MGSFSPFAAWLSYCDQSRNQVRGYYKLLVHWHVKCKRIADIFYHQWSMWWWCPHFHAQFGLFLFVWCTSLLTCSWWRNSPSLLFGFCANMCLHNSRPWTASGKKPLMIASWVHKGLEILLCESCRGCVLKTRPKVAAVILQHTIVSILQHVYLTGLEHAGRSNVIAVPIPSLSHRILHMSCLSWLISMQKIEVYCMIMMIWILISKWLFFPFKGISHNNNQWTIAAISSLVSWRVLIPRTKGLESQGMDFLANVC